MPVRSYDPKNVQIIVGTALIGGLADGTFATVSRSNDAFTKISGADGEISRAKSNDISGELTLTLAQTSPSNDVLSAIALADEQNGSGVVPIFIKDGSGTSTYVSAFGWIRKIPDSSFSKEIETREWVFDLADFKAFVGGIPAASI